RTIPARSTTRRASRASPVAARTLSSTFAGPSSATPRSATARAPIPICTRSGTTRPSRCSPLRDGCRPGGGPCRRPHLAVLVEVLLGLELPADLIRRRVERARRLDPPATLRHLRLP